MTSHKKAKRKGYQKAEVNSVRKTRVELNAFERYQLVQWALIHQLIQLDACHDADLYELSKGSLTKVAEHGHIHRETVRHIFKTWRDALIADDDAAPDLSSKRAGHCGAHSKLTRSLMELIREVNMATVGRLNDRQFSAYLLRNHGVWCPPRTFHRYGQTMGAIVKKTHVKPTLTERQRMCRIREILSKIIKTDPTCYCWDDMYDMLHLDEAHFTIVPLSRAIRALPGQEELWDNPDHVQHKSYIIKVSYCIYK